MVNWMINLDGSTRSRNIELRLVERIALRTTTKKLAENLFFPLLSFSLFHSNLLILIRENYTSSNGWIKRL